MAKQLLPNLRCVQVVEWAPMSDNVYNDGWDLKLKTPDGDGAATAAVASSQLADTSLDCMFVYFDAVDLAGHSSGFSPQNPSYMQALENVDVHVGTVLNALYARPNYANENWLILVITDHGGIGTGHGGITYEERHIWWIGSGSAVAKQQITGPDPGTYNLLGTGIFNQSGVDQAKLKQSPVQADIAVTALHHLIYETGINPETYPFWVGLDGKSWLSQFSGVDKDMERNNIKVFPNPTTGIVTAWFENPTNDHVTATMLDVSGKVVAQHNECSSTNKITLDVSGQPKGMYVLQIKIGEQLLTRKVELK
ncbi:MAG: T9SS type A sorting domain-containing protein [Bacteroidetes bacterium]|nr:T9SS type A sorting domain-containing protein [Bacteroidota bacterium]